MTGMSKVVEERTKAQTSGLPAGLVKRNVQIEPTEKQELHQITEERRVRALIKQDNIYPEQTDLELARDTIYLLKMMPDVWLNSRVDEWSDTQIQTNICLQI